VDDIPNASKRTSRTLEDGDTLATSVLVGNMILVDGEKISQLE
jgi:hypothetical protein